jgi:hypothetical protein
MDALTRKRLFDSKTAELDPNVSSFPDYLHDTIKVSDVIGVPACTFVGAILRKTDIFI